MRYAVRIDAGNTQSGNRKAGVLAYDAAGELLGFEAETAAGTRAALERFALGGVAPVLLCSLRVPHREYAEAVSRERYERTGKR